MNSPATTPTSPSRPRPSRTAGTSACTAHSRSSAPGRHARRAQQARFDQWRAEYNELRPHEALGDATPAAHYTASPRAYPRRLPPLEYPGHYEVRRVSHNGGIRWHTRWVNVSQTRGGEWIGLVEIDDGEWGVYFGPLHLGRFHERTLRIEDALRRQHRRPY